MKNTWLYTLCGALLLGLAVSCSGMNSILRSGNSDLIYKKALEYYAAEKWSRAITMFESIQHVYDGSTRNDSIAYFTARCKFKDNDYTAASELLDQFRRTYGRSVFIEEAEGLYAMCFFNLSPPPTRDQTTTAHARVAINEFLSRYPKSKHTDNFLRMDSILLGRMQDKAYNNAYTYYKVGRYKSANIALQNALKQYPDSQYREQIMALIVDSKYRLANNSVESKQIDRYLTMLDSYYSFIEEFPLSTRIKELDRMAQQAKDFMEKKNKEKTK